jgi:HSP20 family protein
MSDTMLKDLYQLSREMSRLFEDSPLRGPSRWPETNIYESGDAYVLVSKVPGLSKDEIDISVKDNTLTITGVRKNPRPEKARNHLAERFSGKFERSFLLNQKIDLDKIKAESENGLLIVNLPKAGEAKPRKIEIV